MLQPIESRACSIELPCTKTWLDEHWPDALEGGIQLLVGLLRHHGSSESHHESNCGYALMRRHAILMGPSHAHVGFSFWWWIFHAEDCISAMLGFDIFDDSPRFFSLYTTLAI